MFLFCMLVAPVACIFFFTTLMDKGLPTKLPSGIVDEDNTLISHTIIRTIDALEETDFVASYPSFSDARKAMQRGEIFAFFYIPKGTTEKAIANRQPKISFYTNEAYFVTGSLLMKDFRTASELAGLALTRENLYAKGATEERAMGIIQPIVIDTHPINNPTLDYAVYLNNIIVPGILILLIMLSTTYTIGMNGKTKLNDNSTACRATHPQLHWLGNCYRKHCSSHSFSYSTMRISINSWAIHATWEYAT